jgi:hypothetical protein
MTHLFYSRVVFYAVFAGVFFSITWYSCPFMNAQFLLRPFPDEVVTHCQQTNFTINTEEEDIVYLLDPPPYLHKYSYRFSQRKKLNVTTFIKQISCDSHTTPLIYTKKILISNEKEYNDFYQVGQFPMWYYKHSKSSQDCDVDQYDMSSTPCEAVPEFYYFQRYSLGPLFDAMMTMLFITVVLLLECVFFRGRGKEEQEQQEEELDEGNDKELAQISDLDILLNQINGDDKLTKIEVANFILEWLTKREDNGDTIGVLCNDLSIIKQV